MPCVLPGPHAPPHVFRIRFAGHRRAERPPNRRQPPAGSTSQRKPRDRAKPDPGGSRRAQSVQSIIQHLIQSFGFVREKHPCLGRKDPLPLARNRRSEQPKAPAPAKRPTGTASIPSDTYRAKDRINLSPVYHKTHFTPTSKDERSQRRDLKSLGGLGKLSIANRALIVSWPADGIAAVGKHCDQGRLGRRSELFSNPSIFVTR